MNNEQGSELFHRQIASKDNDLMRQVWGGTPWIVDVFTDNCQSVRYLQIRQWCRENFGPEAWPIHGTAGKWQSGSATLFGWTWFGFAKKEMMDAFEKRWPNQHIRQNLYRQPNRAEES